MKRSIVTVLAALLAGPAAAQADGFLGKAALATEQLDGLRGGFIGDDGLRIALGIERLVQVNGEMVSTTMLHVADLADLRGRGLDVNGPLRTVIQNGPGNYVEPGLLGQLGPGMLTLVQNSLNNQVIVGTTKIDLTISGTRSLQLSDTLSGLNVQLHSALK
jgi:hypothetical protein